MGSRSRGKKKASPRVDVDPSEGITDGEKTRRHVVEGMVMTPDAHSSGNKSILDISDQKNMYHGYVKGEQVQCRVFQKHSGDAGRLDIGVPCTVPTEGDAGQRDDSLVSLSGGVVNDYVPTCADSLSKEGSRKKEDKWLLKQENRWSCGDGCDANVAVWGVFDGHGGKQVATYASHALVKYAAEFCADPVNETKELTEDASHSDFDSTSDDIPLSSPRVLDDHTTRADESDVESVLRDGTCLDQWSSQCELMKRLPLALHRAFLKCDEMACKQFPHGGTTATLAFLCGWQLLVANVGDSCAYLDTGAEVLAVSGNHRLEDNPEEVVRIEKNGGEVAPSSIDGKPAGPIRVWPGGLAMSRTIGDVDAGQLCLAEAEITQVTIPPNGARLFIASDGLWDAVHPKTAAHHTRDMRASEASHKLLSMAIKKDKLKDDVTIIVVDILPPGNDVHNQEHSAMIPRGLHLHRPVANKKTKGKSAVEKLARVWHPVMQPGSIRWIEEDLQRRAEVHHEARGIHEETLAILERQKEVMKQALDEEKKKRAPGKSSLLDELSSLTLSPEDFEGGEEWETVSKHHTQDAEEKPKKYQNKRKNKKKYSNGKKMMDEKAPKIQPLTEKKQQLPVKDVPPKQQGNEGSHDASSKQYTHKKKKFFKKNAQEQTQSQQSEDIVPKEGRPKRRYYNHKKRVKQDDKAAQNQSV